MIADAPVGAEHPEGSIRRLSSGLSLARFDDAKLLEAGKVNLITLDAIVARFGSRWDMRRDQVYAHVQKTLDDRLGLQGSFLRISATDFVICQPHLRRNAGQAACVRYLTEILSHFLGDADLAEAGVHEVIRISDEGVEAVPCGARAAEAGGADEGEEDVPETAPVSGAEVVEPLSDPEAWSPFVASDGNKVRVSCVLEPVFELKSYGRIGFRMARRVILVDSEQELSAAAIANLSRADILRIDLATIARGLDRLRADGDERKAPSIIVPVSYFSLATGRGRTEIVNAFKQASGLVQRGVICEICDIEGVPQSALVSAISLIRPFCLFVVGYRAETGPHGIRELKGVGLQAISLECPRGMEDAEAIGWGRANIDAAKQVVRSVLVYRTASLRVAGMMALLGATHASVRAELAQVSEAPQPDLKRLSA